MFGFCNLSYDRERTNETCCLLKVNTNPAYQLVVLFLFLTKDNKHYKPNI